VPKVIAFGIAKAPLGRDGGRRPRDRRIHRQAEGPTKSSAAERRQITAPGGDDEKWMILFAG
jgi:hypothetical protein